MAAPTNARTKTKTSTRAKPAPSPLALADYLSTSATITGVTLLITAVAVGALAASRSSHHLLSAARLTALVTTAAAVLATFAWLSSTYAGAADLLSGRVTLAAADVPPGDEPAGRAGSDALALPTLWRTALGGGLLVAVWAVAGSGLITAVLDGRRARMVVVMASLAGLAGAAYVAIDWAGRRRGVLAAAAATARPATTTPGVPPPSLRRRAWLQVALPLASAQALVNGALAWVLFHDKVSRLPQFAGAGPALSRHAALADVVVIVVIISVVFGTLAGTWGAVDAALGRVVPDDPGSQTLRPGTRLGAQGIVYIAAAGYVLGRLVSVVLPKAPTLAEVMVVRGLFAGTMVLAVSAAAYVRGAVNPRHGTGPTGGPFPSLATGDAEERA